MKFNSGTNSIVDKIDFLCDSDSTSFPIKDKTREINAFWEELIGDIINADGTWQYDDTNHTDQPIGTGTLIEGQESYSFAAEYLDIEAIEILDLDSSTYRKIKPLDRSEIPDGLSDDEYFSSTGFPEYYDKHGDTITLFPAPTATIVTLAKGLRISFKRTATLFTTADTTKEPGLPSTSHQILAYMASIPYCMKYHQDRVGLYERKVESMRKKLLTFYASREKDKRKIMRNKHKSFR